LVEANRTDYFSQNKKAIRTEERELSVAEAKQELEELLQQRRQDPRIAGPVVDARIQDLNDRINGTGKYAPKAKETKVEGAVTNQEGGAKELRDYTTEVKNAYVTVRNMSPAQRKALITSLKNAGYNPPNVSEVYTDQLANEYLKAIQENSVRSRQFGEISFNEFLTEKTIENNALKKSGTGLTTTVDTDVDIVRKTKGQIDQDISEIAIKVLGRDISEEDKVEDWYKNLVNSIGKMYEKGTKTVTTATTRRGDGSTVSGSKRIVTPSVAEADIDALIERRLRKNDPESVGRKERLDFVSWMNKALGD
jgi:light-regulated signal transduction histidine kinase (bacteriophytochrome)